MINKLTPCGWSDGSKQRPTAYIKTILTHHAMERLTKRFGVENPQEIEKVFRKALTGGDVSVKDDNMLVEYGCLVIAGKIEEKVFTVQTVYNLSEGISNRLKDRLAESTPSPWEENEVVLPEEQYWSIVQDEATSTHLTKGYGTVKESA